MDVSVIIVNWNTKGLLCNCLQSILEHAGDVNYEIIVVDNASSDGSADMVQSCFPKATVIVEETNSGYAAATNDGIRVAHGRYVLVLNSDTLICDAAIEKTVGYADKHPEAAVFGCQVRESPDKVQMTCFRFPSLLNLFLRVSGLAMCFKKNRFFGREDMRWWQRDTEQEVDTVSGMFMLVRREAIDEVGLMDEAYFLYCEETDWCYRFAKAGWKILFWPGAFILHPDGGGHSSKSQELRLRVQMQKSILLFFKKHHGVIQYLLARLNLMVYMGLRCFASVLVLIGKHIAGKDVIHELKESRSRWSVFKYCVSGSEPERVNRKLQIFLLFHMQKITKLFLAMAYAIILPLVQKKPYRIVLYYHGVREQYLEAFEKQMSYLASRCKVVRVSEILAAEPDDFNAIVAVTFDDAFVSVLKNGLPVLKRHGLTASVFVPTGDLAQPPKWDIPEDSSDRNEVVMSKEQLGEIDKDGFEILSHAISHSILTELNDPVLKSELSLSKHALEGIIGHEVCGISYPHGAYDSRVCMAAKQAGYLLGYTIEPCIVDSHTDSMHIGRVSVSPGDSLFEFKLKVSGAYQVLSYLKTVKKKLFRRFH